MSREEMQDFEGTQAGRERYEVGSELTSKLSLWEKWRPDSFDEVVGQNAAVAKIKAYLQRQSGNVWWISGPSGTGKTTLARLIGFHQTHHYPDTHATALGWDSYHEYYVDDLKRDADFERFTNKLCYTGVCSIVNEAHGLALPCIRRLSVFIERCNIPESSSLIFTALRDGFDEFTKKKSRDADALLSRCHLIKLSKRVQPDFIKHCQKIAREENLDNGCRSQVAWEKMAKRFHGNCRFMLEALAGEWALGTGDDTPDAGGEDPEVE